MPKFEYWHGFVDANTTNITDWLNQAGANGWELVNMTPDWDWGYDAIEQTHTIIYPNPDYSSGGFDQRLEIENEYTVDAPYATKLDLLGWYCTLKRQKE